MAGRCSAAGAAAGRGRANAPGAEGDDVLCVSLSQRTAPDWLQMLRLMLLDTGGRVRLPTVIGEAAASSKAIDLQVKVERVEPLRGCGGPSFPKTFKHSSGSAGRAPGRLPVKGAL